MRKIGKEYIDSSDEELMICLADSNQSAFAVIYQRWSQKLFGYFYKMLWQNKELAEDFTQELFIRIVKNAKGFDTGRSFSTWAYSIANNMCKNEYRRVENMAKNSIALRQDKTVKPPDPDMKIFRDALAKCTGELSEEKKALFVLRFHDNLSVPDISEILGIPEGTIKSRIFYLLKEMKGKLAAFEKHHIYP